MCAAHQHDVQCVHKATVFNYSVYLCSNWYFDMWPYMYMYIHVGTMISIL